MKPIPGQQALRRGRFSVSNAAYFITTCAARRRPIFASRENASLAINAIQWLRRNGKARILGYVVMPDHVHLVLILPPGGNLSKTMQVWKGFTSRVLRERRRVRPPVWQKGFYDHAARDETDLRARLQYMHENPVRKGIVNCASEYPFSSAHEACRKDDVDAW